MASESEGKTFDRETLLDLTVNAIPLGIILFFILVFALLNPFGSSPVNTAIQFSILLLTFAALAALTYVSGKAISEAEEEWHEKDLQLSEEKGADTTPEPANAEEPPASAIRDDEADEPLDGDGDGSRDAPEPDADHEPADGEQAAQEDPDDAPDQVTDDETRS